MSNKYILVTGAPGSRWSGFVNDCLYTRPDVDTSDQSPNREYWAHGDLMHKGAYFDPSFEFMNSPESEWDKPFSGTGYRVIKSHTFAFMLDRLKEHGHDMYLIHRPDDECYEWWHTAGGWDITYPDYRRYYWDNDGMKDQIRLQNKHILDFVKQEGLEGYDDGKRTIYRWRPPTNTRKNLTETG